MSFVKKKIWYTCEEDHKSFPISEDLLLQYRINTPKDISKEGKILIENYLGGVHTRWICRPFNPETDKKPEPNYYVPLNRTISNRIKAKIDQMTEEERQKNNCFACCTEGEAADDFLEYVKEQEEYFAKEKYMSCYTPRSTYDKKDYNLEERIYACALGVREACDRDHVTLPMCGTPAFNELEEIIKDYDPRYLHPKTDDDRYSKLYRDAKKEAIAKGKDPQKIDVIQEYQKDRKPETSLSPEMISRFDRMSDSTLAMWCNFSKNWAWVVPCLFLCLFVNKGLISAIVLIVLMIAGEVYSSMVNEYVSVIIPWYKKSGQMMEKRILKK